MKASKILLGIIMLCIAPLSFAWQHEISFAYGNGEDIAGQTAATGYFLNGALIKFRADNMLIITIDGSAAHWISHANINKNLNTFAVSAAFRAYFLKQTYKIRPYLQLSTGPGYLSNQHFGNRYQGSRFTFQDTLTLGTELGGPSKSIDIGIKVVHYSNADLFRPNPAFNMPVLLSIGYQG